MTDILIKNGIVLTMNHERRILIKGAVAIEKNRIIAVGKTRELVKRYHADEIIDAKNKLVMPGLINAHSHAHMHLSRGLFLGLGANPWLEAVWKYYWPFLTGEDLYVNVLLTALDMIKTGTTCFVDCGTFPHHSEEVVRAIDEIGIRAVLARATSDIYGYPAFSKEFEETTEESAERAEAFVRRWDHAADDRIRAWFDLHQVFSCSDELCVKMKEYAAKHQVGILTHAAVHETMNEICIKRFGVTEIERLGRLGVLGPNLLAAHMGSVTMKEFALVKDYDVKVCHVPSGSLFFGYGSVSKGMFPEMIDAGITVALGTDGATCSNFVDMVRAMYLTSACHKEARLNSEIMPPEKTVEMATINGAKALLLENEIGSIDTGKKADITIFDLRRPEWTPVHKYNLINNLVYSASGQSVDTVIVDGRIVMENMALKTVDEQKILEEANKAGEKIVNKIEKTGQVKTPWEFIEDG